MSWVGDANRIVSAPMSAKPSRPVGFALGAVLLLAQASSQAQRTEAKAKPVRIVATDTGFDAPRAVPPGLRHVVFQNRGKQIHEAMLVKLSPGQNAAGFQAQVKDGVLFPKGALDYSGPGLTSAGETTELWLRLDPGDYVLICWHHARTSVRAFAVQGTAVDDAAPAEDAVLQVQDFRFELRGRLKEGTQVIKVQSLGPSMHEADLFRLHPGRTAADVARWYKDDLADPAPADILGGVLDSHDITRVVWLRRRFTPGRYVFHCALPTNLNAKSGEPSTTHADLGMVMTFEIGESRR